MLPFFLPAAAFAQALGASVPPTSGTKDLKYVIGIIVYYLNLILELIMGVAVVMFVFYVVRYFIQANDKRAEAATYVLWSLIGFFVIFSMWGLVNVLTNTFSLQQNPSNWSTYFQIFPK